MKLIGKLFLGLIGLSLFSYSIFTAKEYLVGNNYLQYLNENKESVSSDENFSFSLMKEDLGKHQLILVGEIHGFEEPTKFDIEFFSHLNRNFGVKYYFQEMDFSQAYFMNLYNQNGSDSLLKKILAKWVVSAGRDNKDYFQRFKRLREEVFTQNNFTYIGNNNLSDVQLLFAHLNSLTKSNAIQFNSQASDSLNLLVAKEYLVNQLASNSCEYIFEYSHLLTNINYWFEGKKREEILTENFINLYKRHNLKKEKVYGFYGLGHTLLEPIKERHQPMASRLQTRDKWFKNNILSINFLFSDSHMIVKNAGLPSFLQSEGKYKRLSVSYDNIWLSYLHGIKDLQRVTQPNTKTIFKLNSTESPYKDSNRLLSMSKILPVGQLLNAAENIATAQYSQYMVFVRNSDWAEPFSNELD